MTVRELIEALHQHPPDTRVMMPGQGAAEGLPADLAPVTTREVQARR